MVGKEDPVEQPLSAEEVAERLAVNEQTVRRWLRDGDLVGKFYGGRTGWRVSQGSVIEFLRNRDPRLGKIRNELEARGIPQRAEGLRAYVDAQGWGLVVEPVHTKWPTEWTAEVKVDHAPGQVTWSRAVDHVTEADAIADAVAMAIRDKEERLSRSRE
jgi:excisionase family DNA binding protein